MSARKEREREVFRLYLVKNKHDEYYDLLSEEQKKLYERSMKGTFDYSKHELQFALKTLKNEILNFGKSHKEKSGKYD